MENHQVALEAASLARPQLNFYFSFSWEIKAIVSTLGPDPSDLKQIAYATWWLCLGTQEGSREFPQILRTPFGCFWREKKDCGVSERKEGLERAETGRPPWPHPVPGCGVTAPLRQGWRARLSSGARRQAAGSGSAVTASLWLDPHHQSPVQTRGKRNGHSHAFQTPKRGLTEVTCPRAPRAQTREGMGSQAPPDPRAHASPPWPLRPLSVSHRGRVPGGGLNHRKSPKAGFPSLLQGAMWLWATHQLSPDSQARGRQGQRWRIN